MFLLLREWSAAVTSFERATRLKPLWATAWFRLARALSEARDVNQSRKAFQRAIALGSPDPQARFRGGEILRLAGRYDEATAELREAVQLDPNNGDAWFALGRTLRARNDWPAAQEAYEKSIALKPDFADAYFGLAEPLKMRGKTTEAERAYRKAIELRPTLADAYTFLAPLLERGGRTQEAEEVLQKGVKACPSSPRIYSYLGERMFRRNHNPLAAERLFAEAVRLKPSYVEALVGLAAAQRKLAVGNPNYLDNAVANNLLALARDPDNESAYLGLGLCYLDLKKWEDAATAFAHVTQCRPDMAVGWFYRGMAFRLDGRDVNEILGQLQTARKLGFDPKRCDLEQARLLAERGRAPEALVLLSALAKADGGKLQPYLCRDRSFEALRNDAGFIRLCHQPGD